MYCFSKPILGHFFFFSWEVVKRTHLLEHQLSLFIISMQNSIERSGPKWLKPVITTKAWDDFAREAGQEALALPEFPADGRALFCNIIFTVCVADDKGTALHIQGHFPRVGHTPTFEGSC